MSPAIKCGAPANQKYAWVTTATDEKSAYEAIALVKSIKRSITIADTIVLISDELNRNLRKLLEQTFDCILPVNVKQKEPKQNLSETDLLKMFSCSLEMYNKIIVLNSNNLILKNCDELFEMEGKFHISKRADNQNSIFVIKPQSMIYTELKNMSLSSQNRCLTDCLIAYFGLSIPIDTKSQLPNNYAVSTDDLQNNLTEMEEVRIITYDFSFMKKIVTPDRFQKIKDLWISCRSDNEHHQLEIKENVKLNQKDYYKNSFAIIGQSCRFPKSNNSDEFWKLLKDGQDGFSSFPVERLGYSQLNESDLSERTGGFLKCPIDEFDAQFFGMSPQEAVLIDPQQRLLLEVAWEALENAAINPLSLKGSNAGVFTGIWQSYYDKLVKETTDYESCHNVVLENSFSAISTRISDILGLNGPNITTKSGCSSSLLALHLACESLKRCESDLGLVLGSNLLIKSDSLDNKSSNVGQCKKYDENTDECSRAEGIAAIILKRLPDAIKNGDRVIGIIRGSAINNERTSSFGAQSKTSQEIAIKSALKNSGVVPSEVDYVEAHSTLANPVELAALTAAYAGERQQPLAVGSMKSNIGHCESAAGLASIIKIILCMKHEIIPRHSNIDTLNPDINLKDASAPLPIVGQKPWKKNTERVRIAGINSFGVSKTNVHVILEEPPNNKEYCPVINNPLEADRTFHILNLSAKTDIALDDLADRYIKYFKENPSVNPQDLTFTANNGRAHFKNRVSVIGKNIPELTKALTTRSRTRPVAKKPIIAFLFTGQGSQYFGMAKVLYKSNTIFRNAFNRCATSVEKKTGIDLRNVLWDDSSKLNHCVASQLSIFSVEYGLLSLLFSLGVKPDVVFGHSVGEFAAAVASGIVDVDDALTLLIGRSQLISQMGPGGMVALSCSAEKGEELISAFEKLNKGMWLDIAVVNSIKQIVVAGKKDAIQKFQEFCKAKSMTYFPLAAAYAFHSREIDSILEEFGKVTSTIKYKSPVCKYVSGMSGSLLGENEMKDGTYWHRHARNRVNFPKGMQTTFDNGCNIFIEVGPRPILLALGMANTTCDNFLWLPTLHQVKDNWETLLDSLGKLYVNGIDINWSGIDTPEVKKKLELPTYPFQRQSYWVSTSSEKKEKIQVHPLLGKQIPLAVVKENVFANEISLTNLPYLIDHQVANLIIIPGAGFLEIIAAAGKHLLQKDPNTTKTTAIHVQNFFIQLAFELEEKKTYQMQVVATPVGGQAKSLDTSVYVHYNLKGWTKHAGAKVTLVKETDIQSGFVKENVQNIKLRCGAQKTTDEFYKKVDKIGIQFGEKFRSLEFLWAGENEVLASVPLNSYKDMDNYLFHPIVLDAMLQACVAVMEMDGTSLYLPIGIDHCFVYSGKVTNVAFVHAKWHPNKSSATVALYGEDNSLLVAMNGARLIKTTVQALLNAMNRQKSGQ